MEKITLELSTIHEHGAAFFDYLALRKQFFVDTLGWSIPHNDSVEMDQYDNPEARYSLVVEDGKVLAGARAMPTTVTWGGTSYMLRDALIGKLPGIPADLLGEEIVSPSMWECSRLVIAPEVEGIARRTEVLGLICEGLVDMAIEGGATEMMTLSNLWLLRALRKLGYEAELMSRPYTNAEDNHRYAVMKMQARHVHRFVPEVVPFAVQAVA